MKSGVLLSMFALVVVLLASNSIFAKCNVAQSPVDTSNRTKVIYAFCLMLDREPDPEGLGYFEGELSKGVSVHEMFLKIFFSAEFQNATKSLSDEAWLGYIYQHLLRRGVDPDGRTYWLQQISNGRSRTSVAEFFFDSPEFHSRFPLFWNETPSAPSFKTSVQVTNTPCGHAGGYLENLVNSDSSRAYRVTIRVDYKQAIPKGDGSEPPKELRVPAGGEISLGCNRSDYGPGVPIKFITNVIIGEVPSS